MTPVGNENAERDALLERYGMTPGTTTQEATRAARDARLKRRGMWSVVLAVGSGVLVPVLSFGAVVMLMPMGGQGDPDFQAAFSLGLIVIDVIAIAVAISAVVLGITTIVGAWPPRGREGRVLAIVLAVFATAISTLICMLLLWGLFSPTS